MLDKFQQWLKEVQHDAINKKKSEAALLEGEARWESQIWRAPDKNKDIKRKFHLEGNRLGLGYRSRPTFEPEKKSREWLYDFVWRKFDEQNNLVEVVLVMEIEISDISEYSSRHDFNKLLQADSTYKIFVFQMKTATKILMEFDQLKQLASRYGFRSDSDFLLCGWATQENQFHFDRFEARCPRPGAELDARQAAA